VNKVAFANRADAWLYDQYNSGDLWVTHNGGRSRREVTMLNSLDFTSQKTGSFVTGNPASTSGGQPLRTTDAGRTWHLVRI
jgi:hypothetical protein